MENPNFHQLFLPAANALLSDALEFFKENALELELFERRKREQKHWSNQRNNKRNKTDYFQTRNVSFPDTSDTDIFFCSQGRNTYGVAIKSMKVEQTMVGFRLGPFTTEDAKTKRVTVADKSNKRIKGFQIAQLDELAKLTEQSGSPELHKADLATKLAKTLCRYFPDADTIFSLITLSISGLQQMEELINLDRRNYNILLDEGREYIFAYGQHCKMCMLGTICACHCGFVEKAVPDEHNSEGETHGLIFCMDCNNTLEDKRKNAVTLYPKIEFEDMQNTVKLIKEHLQHNRFPSKENERDFCLKMLREVTEFKKHIDDMAEVDPEQFKEECEKYTKLEWSLKYTLKNLERKEHGDNSEDTVGRMTQSLKASLQTKTVGTSEAVGHFSEGAMLDVSGVDERKLQASSEGSMTHLDPASAVNVKAIFRNMAIYRNLPNVSFWWVIHPLALDSAVKHLQKNELLKNVLTKEDVQQAHLVVSKQCGTNKSWIVEQKHGDLVTIPTGYAHCVVNTGGGSLKIAKDFLEHNSLFECTICHVHLWRRCLDLVNVQDYMQVAEIVEKQAQSVFKKLYSS